MTPGFGDLVRRHRGNRWDVIAPIFIFLAPFFSFLKFNNYNYLAFEILIIYNIIIICGMIVGFLSIRVTILAYLVIVAAQIAIFVDFQFDWGVAGPLASFALTLVVGWVLRKHLGHILSVTFSVMVVATVLAPSEHVNTAAGRVDTPKADEASKILPPIVHVILDGHLAINGFPAYVPEGLEIGDAVRKFYLDNGFIIFPNAYSSYIDTQNSLSNLLNFTLKREESAWYDELSEPRILYDNAYFDLLADRGYRIRVYQSNWIDFCQVPNIKFRLCTTYNFTGIEHLQSTNMSNWDKVWIITTTYFKRSGLYRKIIRKWYREIHGRLGHPAFMPKWNWDRGHSGAVIIPSVAAELAADLKDSPYGTLYFAHLVMPHFPYAFDRQCKLKPVKNWTGGGPKNYLDYLLCATRIISRILDRMKQIGIYEDAIVIVHGDHGSKLSRSLEPNVNNKDLATPDDYRAYFSTLFAIKVPGHGQEIVPDVASIQVLFGKLLTNKDWAVPTVEYGPPFVLLSPGSKGSTMLKHPFPGFHRQ